MDTFLCIKLSISLSLSEEGGVGVFNDATLAVALDETQRVERHIAVLHVKQLQVKTVGRHHLQPAARDALARLQAQAFQIEAVEREYLQPGIRHQWALADVQALELETALG